MNNEDKPITSRRERRRAHAGSGEALSGLTPAQARAEAEAKAEAEAGGIPTESTETGRIRARRALDAPVDAVRAERMSQARARDREAHRVLRELAEKERAAQLPSRRALREQAPETRPEQAEPRQAAGPAVPPKPAARPSSGDIPAGTLPVVQGPVPPTGGPPARPGEVPPSSVPQSAPPRPVREAPVRQAPDGSPVLGPQTGSFSMLSHEQIAAARELLREQAKSQGGARGQGGEPDAVDPETLKQQVAQAERAAVLNRRAQARQRLAEESRRDAGAAEKPGAAPTAAHNLAMVTPLEYVKVPGLPHPVMKPPTTTHVQVVTDRTPTQRGPQRGPAREAAPVSAVTAHGLEPLAPQKPRGSRERVAMLSIGVFGLVALVVAVLIVLLGR